MKNFVQTGENVDGLVAPRALASGEGVLIGSLFSFALAAVANGATFVGVTRGVFDHAKAAVTITQGQKAYWDDTAHVLTNVASGNTLIGVFTQAATSGAATGRVKLGIVA